MTLFGPTDARLPKWFREADWGVKVNYYRTSFLPTDLGLVEVEAGGVPLKISSAPPGGHGMPVPGIRAATISLRPEN
ncbi:type IV toxin-antitoxin system AbiEi family antitoxin domain-containing protein [Neomesorhizobium albiziae]|uniref:type IV toxin-antitoxin system AbiEi family antitoxin domain-containing protein n=1 Tax=Neomesorhizobium albiziae TaxID=335020 RepID=UPI00165F716C|nr:hypothetical protein GCM10007937_24540 [Mesorhizobium albiziae]